jgi:hypothetical protein
MSFISPLSAYRLLERITPHLTRGGMFKTTKLGSKKVEISFTPGPGVKENPQQCENRLRQVDVKSEGGKGTTFDLYFPVRPEISVRAQH